MKKYSKTEQRERSKRLEYFEGLFLSVLAFENETGKNDGNIKFNRKNKLKMGENTKIEWCDHTVNLWHGCAKVHTGCKNCYAETQAKRWGFDIWGENKDRKEIKSAFKDLEKYEKQAKETGKKAVVFIGSMMDIFEGSKPLVNTKGEKMVYTTASPFGKVLQKAGLKMHFWNTKTKLN